MKKRHTYSKQKIKLAMIQLLLEKEFEKISVADITREAKINRGTFYLHYIDKFDLIDKLLLQFKADLFELLDNADDNEQHALESTLDYLLKNRAFIAALSKSKASDLQNEITHFLYELLSRNHTLKADITQSLHFSQEYAYTAFFGSITSIIIHWIHNDFLETPDEISLMMIAIRQLFKG